VKVFLRYEKEEKNRLNVGMKVSDPETACAMLSMLIVRFRGGSEGLFIPEPTDCGGDYPIVYAGLANKQQDAD